jgi:hypothetical protein
MTRLSSIELAELIADALLIPNIIKRDDLAKAIKIITEEIDARKAVQDY